MRVVLSLKVQQPDLGIRGVITAYYEDQPDPDAAPATQAGEVDR